MEYFNRKILHQNISKCLKFTPKNHIPKSKNYLLYKPFRKTIFSRLSSTQYIHPFRKSRNISDRIPAECIPIYAYPIFGGDSEQRTVLKKSVSHDWKLQPQGRQPFFIVMALCVGKAIFLVLDASSLDCSYLITTFMQQRVGMGCTRLISFVRFISSLVQVKHKKKRRLSLSDQIR